MGNWFSILFCSIALPNDERIATQGTMLLELWMVLNLEPHTVETVQMAKCLLFPASMVFDTSQSLNLLHF